MRLLAWTDGGGGSSTPDPEAYIGVLVMDEEGTVLLEHAEGIGQTTHNVAEYTAVLTAIRFAVERRATSLRVRSDSRLVVKQINGEYRVTKPHLAALLADVREAAEGLDFEIEWVPRKENAAADELTWKLRSIQGP